MNGQRGSIGSWLALACLLVSVWGCAGAGAPAGPAEGATGFDETSFWEGLPRPDGAQAVEVSQGFDLGLVTGMVEPELFDFYATWLRERGWQEQAPTEAMMTLPRKVWRKDGVELLIEIQGLDDQGRTVVWFRVEELGIGDG
jgi:hypothetical protein